ncbi:MAG TPA: 16S rRNA (cytosine(1402)-N(4))-methyltransferase RsmH [Pseudomonadota bacterium]|nr:16S rRNA (cytosine(1402)-N(4))-methyltransferase RsmH [Pseudomonadota bacterium]
MQTNSASVSATVHRAVMMEEVLRFLAPQPGGIYCDATLGAGGHTEQILRLSAPDGRVYGIDRDPTALQIASERLAPFGDRFIPLHGRFGDAAALLAARGVPPLSGLLADLGVSSMQLDRPERGFSFQGNGPIDMRMDPSSGETALELIGRLSEESLAAILREYGEERHARRIARVLQSACADGELRDTHTLAEVVARAVPGREPHKHPATRTFQALRIAVNDELRQLHQLLSAAPRLLAPGGRLVVISFHSLEDRLVKQHFQHAAVVRASQDADARPPFLALCKKPVEPSEQEVRDNPRARSARLRAAQLTRSLESRPCPP